MHRSFTRGLTLFTLASSLIAPATSPSAADDRGRVRKDQWHLAFLHVEKAQQINDGVGVVVAVPDTGVYPHPDLKDNLLPGTDVSGSGDGRDDGNGHGTSMAGLIAAHGDGKGLGALGIAPKAKVLPIRSRLIDGEGDADELAASIEWAVTHQADVISVSAVAGASVRLQRAIRSALAANVVVVASAGNRPEDVLVGYPASEPGVIAVGGVDRHGLHAQISVTGPEIDVVAPAVDIYSTSYGGKYSKGTGTSGATAIVAGAAALIRSKYPDLPAQEVAHRLTATAIDKGPPGRDDEYGYGVIDLVAALTADVPPLGFESPSVTAPASTAARGNRDGNSTARGLATLGVLLAAGGGYLLWRRRRRAEDPPPRISR
ncbi:S8 family serine peptidase [Micromonospora sp. AP08]|uniref:S8 family serine peptidase n=1 Tax=Micromonospora sp. AP08 TaxID=2604467 RepID=UPI0011D72614|nr:S8 family serine peptidase [Micromonospora sp. AP08]TYB39013.1 S8 family serine peptidase [Micromonospora sp. AP08]